MTTPPAGGLAADDRRAAANALLTAYRTREPIPPLTSAYPGLRPDDAYAIQAEQIAVWAAAGRVVRGYKVGLTSQAMQTMLGVDQPDYGFLVDGMYHDEGSTVDPSRWIAPRIEPEIAVFLGADLQGPGVTLDDVEASVESVVGTLEIVDSRIKDWKITIADTIADNASSGGVVVGRDTLPLSELDIVEQRVELRKNGEAVGHGYGAAVLGSPLNAVLWLANRLGELGVPLRAGSLVLPGAVCAMVPIAAGDRIEADFGRLGRVRVAFGTEG
jgi:2-keto-4-pentenoate hydratase